MKRSLLAGLLGFALILAGCGGDDDTASSDDATTSSDDGAAATVAPTATASAGDDGAAEPTSEPTVGAPSRAVAAAEGVAGTYSGDWNNTTFGSTGAIDMELDVDAEAESAIIRLDLGGFVFGGADPDPIVFEIDLAAEQWLGGGTDLFGETDFTVDDNGGWVLHSGAVPGVGGLEMTMTASAVSGGYEGAYEIVGLAEGTFALTKQ